MNKYNWAVLGCGKIAEKFVRDLRLLPNAVLYAAASRDINKSTTFADKFGFEKAYGSYEDMVCDKEVDIVYVCTPHSFHYQHTLLCLTNKKNVICEKPFALNSEEVARMIACAHENRVFLIEAFWTRFVPSFQIALEILQTHKLGKVLAVRSDFSFKADVDPDSRLFDLNLGGGSLMDIGIYPVFMTISVLGKPVEIKTIPVFGSTGADESITISFKYKEGQIASLFSSLRVHSSRHTEYCCEKGYLRLNKNSYSPSTITICESGDNEEKSIDIPEMQGFGYSYEAAHVMECLDKGLLESDLLPLSFSQDLMEVLDSIRKAAGIVYPSPDL